MKELVTPKQVALALGVSEASLKRWCDKGLLPVIRTPGGHRRLPINGVMQFIRRQGRSLVKPEVLGLPPSTGRTAASMSRAQRLFRAALETGDADQCTRLAMNVYLAGQKVYEICDNIIAASFHEIGDRWSHGDVEVYQERRGVEICRQLLVQLRLSVPDPGESAPVAIGGTLEHDPYSLPTSMAELALLEAGWDARSYGSGHPVQTLCAAIRDVRPRLFWLSISSFRSEQELVDQCRMIQEEAQSNGTAFVVGGRALSQNLRERLTYSAHCDTLRHLAAFADTLNPVVPDRDRLESSDKE